MRTGLVAAWVLAAAFSMFAAGSVRAAPPDTAVIQRDASVVLEWDEAWKRAVEHNEQHRIAKNEVRKARLQVLEAYSNAMPTLDFSGNLNHYFEIPSNPVTMPGELNFANPGEPFTAEFKFGLENNMSANLQLTQPVWLAGKVGLALRIAKNYRKIADMSEEVSRQDLRVQLAEAFYGAMIADDYVEVARDAVKQARRHRDRVQALFEQGVVSEYELIRARVAVSNLEPQALEAENAREMAYRALKNLIGMSVDRPVTLQGDVREVILQPELDYEDASSYALGQRLELQQLDLQKRLYEGQREIESRSWLWPNLLAGLRWETLAQSETFAFHDKRFFSGVSAQLILNIPLFDGFASHRRAQIAEVNKRNVELQKSMLERGIRLDVYQRLRRFTLAGEQLEAAIENRAEAEKGYRIAQTRYEEGVGTQLEVLDAQLQLNSSRVNVLQAQYDQLVVRAKYDRALGRMWNPGVETAVSP
ncbi:MAG: Cobalt-zinc-cadmium resistance protein CzcC [Calditrichaeota bacterium]|nr:Cobalt-zinc-cadmium resistance protein CzcC [Calditrichota bacterium]